MAFSASTAPTRPLCRNSCKARRAASTLRATIADSASPSATCTATRRSASISISSESEPMAPSTSRRTVALERFASIAICSASARAAEMLASDCAVPNSAIAASSAASADARAVSASLKRCASSPSLRPSASTTLRKRSMSSFSPRPRAVSSPTFCVARRASSNVETWSPASVPSASTAATAAICSDTVPSSLRNCAASASSVAITPESISWPRSRSVER